MEKKHCNKKNNQRMLYSQIRILVSKLNFQGNAYEGYPIPFVDELFDYLQNGKEDEFKNNYMIVQYLDEITGEWKTVPKHLFDFVVDYEKCSIEIHLNHEEITKYERKLDLIYKFLENMDQIELKNNILKKKDNENEKYWKRIVDQNNHYCTNGNNDNDNDDHKEWHKVQKNDNIDKSNLAGDDDNGFLKMDLNVHNFDFGHKKEEEKKTEQCKWYRIDHDDDENENNNNNNKKKHDNYFGANKNICPLLKQSWKNNSN